MAEFVERALIHRLGSIAVGPVVLVQGPRAVGKTTALRRQIATSGSNFTFASLEDTGVLADAAGDPYGWMVRMGLPLVVDEVQLVPGLPNAAKRLVDARTSKGLLILTGSASIGLDTLAGANPLAGRSQTFTMWPLTAWELNAQRGSIVDALFDGDPIQGHVPPLGDSDLLDELRRGGLPLNRFSDAPLTGPRLAARVESDLRSRLTDRIDPRLEFDAIALRAVADHLLAAPGAVFNAKRVSDLLQIDARTARRYLDLLERLFVVAPSLRNLDASPTKQAYQRVKVYPMDTSFSVDALRRAGVDPAERREVFGQLLEAYVGHQLRAAIEWSIAKPQVFYWRDSRQREVDFVLQDDMSRVIGIEVKSAATVSLADARGLRALADARGLYRGFVVYRGTEVRQLGDSIWALPLESLLSAASFGGSWMSESPAPTGAAELSARVSAAGIAGVPQTRTTSDATVFLSYVHADDEASGGRMVQFARDIVNQYEFLTGRSLSLFVDRDDIVWGQQWRYQIEDQLDRTTFLMPLVTPRYLQSEPCIAEIQRFGLRLDAHPASSELISLIWADIDATHVARGNESVRARLAKHQYVEVTGVRLLDPDSTEYRGAVERVAERLAIAVSQREPGTQFPGSEISLATVDDDGPDFVEALQDFEAGQAALEDAIGGFGIAFDAIGRAFESASAPSNHSPAALQAALAHLGRATAGPAEQLSDATRTLAIAWAALELPARQLVGLYQGNPSNTGRADLRDSIGDVAASLTTPEMQEMRSQVRIMGSASRHLRPLSRALEGALDTVETIRDSMIGLRNSLDP